MIAAVVLAAGEATRFGATKQLETYRGKPLVRHAVDAARDAGIQEVVVVVGHDGERVAAAVRDARIVVNARYAEGQSTSLIAGLDALGPGADAAVILLADQPGVTSRVVRALTDAAATNAHEIVRLAFAQGRGPTLLRRAVWDEVRALTGDAGARVLAERRPELVFEARVAGPAPVDVDTPEDLERLDG